MTPAEDILLERAVLDGGLAIMRKSKGRGKQEAARVVKLLSAFVALRDKK